MRLIRPSFAILSMPEDLRLIEIAGRTCYKSEKEEITAETAEKFSAGLVRKGHWSVIEHLNMTVRFICDRGVSHELVRHRIASFSQESTRYCRYKGHVTFVIPPWCRNIQPGEYGMKTNNIPGNELDSGEKAWFWSVWDAERMYHYLLSASGWSPQQARSVLPNSLKTEVVMTANLREWVHIFRLRCSEQAHPQMRELMIPLRNRMAAIFPSVFMTAFPSDFPIQQQP